VDWWRVERIVVSTRGRRGQGLHPRARSCVVGSSASISSADQQGAWGRAVISRDHRRRFGLGSMLSLRLRRSPYDQEGEYRSARPGAAVSTSEGGCSEQGRFSDSRVAAGAPRPRRCCRLARLQRPIVGQEQGRRWATRSPRPDACQA